MKERRQIEEKLESQKTAALEGKIREWEAAVAQREAQHQGNILYIRAATHDFNNLLMVISGEVELALGIIEEALSKRRSFSRAQGNELYDYLQCTQYATKRAIGLVEELFGFDYSYKPEDIDLNEIILQARGLESSVRRKTQSHYQIKIHPKSKYKIYGDEDKIYRLVQNLVFNAAEAMQRAEKHSGVIVVKAEDMTINGRTTIYPEMPQGNYVRLSVSDNGTGIEPDKLLHLFRPGYTIKRDSKDGMHGLGLSIVSWVAKMHGAHIDVHSVVGKGSTFSVYFPALSR